MSGNLASLLPAADQVDSALPWVVSRGFSQVQKFTRKFQMSKWNEKKKEKNTYIRTSRLEKSEELQPNQNHAQFMFLTVLLLFAQGEPHYW
jgi:hypothetical protein